MAYRVAVTGPAKDDIGRAFSWIKDRSPAAATKWFNGLVDRILSLANQPERCGFAPENQELTVEIRQLLYGNRRYAFRVIFTVEDDHVYILHVRRGSMEALEAKLLEKIESGEYISTAELARELQNDHQNDD